MKGIGGRAASCGCIAAVAVSSASLPAPVHGLEVNDPFDPSHAHRQWDKLDSAVEIEYTYGQRIDGLRTEPTDKYSYCDDMPSVGD